MTVFLDILGFGELVDSSTNIDNQETSIYNLLRSISKEKIFEDCYASINYEKVPAEELKNVEETRRLFAKSVAEKWPITISYFSDSLVLSAENSNACYSILEFICKLYVRIWDEYQLLIRGGISIGKLIHDDNGPIFGPAMNEAYKLESKCAIFPRIVVSTTGFQTLQRVDLYQQMQHIFNIDEDYSNINLASAYNYLINHSASTIISGLNEPYVESLLKTPNAIALKIQQYENTMQIRIKYEWIKDRIESLIKELNL